MKTQPDRPRTLRILVVIALLVVVVPTITDQGDIDAVRAIGGFGGSAIALGIAWNVMDRRRRQRDDRTPRTSLRRRVTGMG